MDHVDKRNILDEEIFTYQATKDGKVMISWHGKQVMILKGKHADKFLANIALAADAKQKQLVMAKVTGNFKRGNEKSSKSE